MCCTLHIVIYVFIVVLVIALDTKSTHILSSQTETMALAMAMTPIVATPLVVAVTQGNHIVVRYLLDFGATVNIFTGPEKRNPLCEYILFLQNWRSKCS